MLNCNIIAVRASALSRFVLGLALGAFALAAFASGARAQTFYDPVLVTLTAGNLTSGGPVSSIYDTNVLDTGPHNKFVITVSVPNPSTDARDGGGVNIPVDISELIPHVENDLPAGTTQWIYDFPIRVGERSASATFTARRRPGKTNDQDIDTTIRLGNLPSGYRAPLNRGRWTVIRIVDPRAPVRSKPTVSFASQTVEEGGNLLVKFDFDHMVRDRGQLPVAVNMQWDNVDGQSGQARNYRPLTDYPTYLQFTPGVEVFTLTIAVRENDSYEGDIRVRPRFPNSYQIISDSALGNGALITDNDGKPEISASAPAVAEGEDLVFTVRLNHANNTDTDLTVPLTMVEEPTTTDVGGGTTPGDTGFVSGGYSFPSSVTIPHGQQEATVAVQTTDYAAAKNGDGYVSLDIGSCPGSQRACYTNDPGKAYGRIIDTEPPNIRVSAAETDIMPGQDAVFTVTVQDERVPHGGIPVSLSVIASGGTASIGTNVNANQTLSFAPGETAKEFRLPVLLTSPVGRVSLGVNDGALYNVAGLGQADINIFKPTVTIRPRGGSLEHYRHVNYLLEATPYPTRDFEINLDVEQVRNYGGGNRQYIDPARDHTKITYLRLVDGYRFPYRNLPVHILDNRVYEKDSGGEIRVTLLPGDGYEVAASPDNTTTNFVWDDDTPILTLEQSAATVSEGETLTFTISSGDITVRDPLTVHISRAEVPANTDTGGGNKPGDTGFVNIGAVSETVVIPAGGNSVSFTVPTTNHYGAKSGDGYFIIQLKCSRADDRAQDRCASPEGGFSDHYNRTAYEYSEYSFAESGGGDYMANDSSEALVRIVDVPAPEITGFSQRGSGHAVPGQDIVFPVTVGSAIPHGGLEVGYEIIGGSGIVAPGAPATVSFAFDDGLDFGDGGGMTNTVTANLVIPTVPGGQTGRTLTVRLLPSTVQPARYTISSAVSQLTVRTTNKLPVPVLHTVTAHKSPYQEGETTEWLFRFNQVLDNPVTVTINHWGGDILDNPPSSVSFAAGEQEKTLTVASRDDNIYRPSMWLVPIIWPTAEYRTSDRRFVRMWDNDTPEISITSSADEVVEGEEITFTVHSSSVIQAGTGLGGLRLRLSVGEVLDENGTPLPHGATRFVTAWVNDFPKMTNGSNRYVIRVPTVNHFGNVGEDRYYRMALDRCNPDIISGVALSCRPHPTDGEKYVRIKNVSRPTASVTTSSDALMPGQDATFTVSLSGDAVPSDGREVTIYYGTTSDDPDFDPFSENPLVGDTFAIDGVSHTATGPNATITFEAGGSTSKIFTVPTLPGGPEAGVIVGILDDNGDIFYDRHYSVDGSYNQATRWYFKPEVTIIGRAGADEGTDRHVNYLLRVDRLPTREFDINLGVVQTRGEYLDEANAPERFTWRVGDRSLPRRDRNLAIPILDNDSYGEFGAIEVTVLEGDGYKPGKWPTNLAINNVNNEDVPIISIVKEPFEQERAVFEGQTLTFAVQSNIELESPLDVRIRGVEVPVGTIGVTPRQVGDVGFVTHSLPDTVRIPAGERTVTFEVPTVNNNGAKAGDGYYFLQVVCGGWTGLGASSCASPSGGFTQAYLDDNSASLSSPYSFVETATSPGDDGYQANDPSELFGLIRDVNPPEITAFARKDSGDIYPGADVIFTVTSTGAVPYGGLEVDFTIGNGALVDTGEIVVAGGDPMSSFDTTVTFPFDPSVDANSNFNSSSPVTWEFAIPTDPDAQEMANFNIRLATVNQSSRYTVASTAPTTPIGVVSQYSPTLSISGPQSGVTEGDPAVFTVSPPGLGGVLPVNPLNVVVSVSNPDGSDFVASGQSGEITVSLSFESGFQGEGLEELRPATFTVETTADTLYEPDGDITVSLLFPESGEYKVSSTNSSATAAVANVGDTPIVSITAQDETIDEGAGNNVEFTVSSNKTLTADLRVDLSPDVFANVVSASIPSFVTLNGSDNPVTLTVATEPGVRDTRDGDVRITLVAPSVPGAYHIDPENAAAFTTVSDTDVASATFDVPPTVIEGDNLVVAVDFDFPSDTVRGPVTVHADTSQAGGYIAPSQGYRDRFTSLLAFAADVQRGTTRGEFTIRTVDNDLDEADGVLTLTIGGPAPGEENAWMPGAVHTATVSIVDNDEYAALTLCRVADGAVENCDSPETGAVVEGTDMHFLVTVEEAPQSALNIAATVSDVPGGDFLVDSGEGMRTVEIPASMTFAKFTVQSTAADFTAGREGNVVVRIANPDRTKYAFARGVVSVAMEDSPFMGICRVSSGLPFSSCPQTPYTEAANEGGAVHFLAFLNKAPENRTEVSIRFTDESAVKDNLPADGGSGFAGAVTRTVVIWPGSRFSTPATVQLADTDTVQPVINLLVSPDAAHAGTPPTGYGLAPAGENGNGINVSVLDNDRPEISICQANEAGDACAASTVPKTEGEDLNYLLTVNSPPTDRARVSVRFSDEGDFLPSGAAVRFIDIPAGALMSGVFTIRTDDDSTDEDDGGVTAVIGNPDPVLFRLAGSSVTIPVADNDIPSLVISPPNFAVDEGDDAVFTIEVDNGVTPRSPLTVVLNVAGSGFVEAANEGEKTVDLNFTGGVATYVVPTHDDGIDEPDGDVTVTLLDRSPAGYTVARAGAVVTVQDNDDAPVVIIAGRASAVDEGELAEFVLTLSNGASGQIAVDILATGDSLAANPPDSVTVPAGETTFTFAVATASDSAYRTGTTPLAVALQAGTGYTTGASDSATVNVNNTDVPELEVAAPDWVYEGESFNARIVVSNGISIESGMDVYVGQANVNEGIIVKDDGTTVAASSSNYVNTDANAPGHHSRPAFYTFGAGDSEISVSVPTTNRYGANGGNGYYIFVVNCQEGDSDNSCATDGNYDHGGGTPYTFAETGDGNGWHLNASNRRDPAEGIIEIRRVPGPVVSVRSLESGVANGGDAVSFEVTAGSFIPFGGITAEVDYSPDSFVSGGDPVTVAFDFNRSAGISDAVSKTVTVLTTRAADGSLTATVQAGTGYTPSPSDGSATVEMANTLPFAGVCPANQAGTGCADSPGDITEGETARFLLTFSENTTEELPVTVTVGEDAEESNNGFLAAGQAGERTITVPSGRSVSDVFTVETAGDGEDEGAKSNPSDGGRGMITAEIGAAAIAGKYTFFDHSAGALGGGTAGITVLDDDAPPVAGFSATAFSGGEDSREIVFTVNLSGASGRQIVLDYTTTHTGQGDGHATPDVDYTHVIAETFTFAPGETTAQFSVVIADDNVIGETETFNVDLHVALESSGNAIIDSQRNTATATILDLPVLTLCESVSPGDVCDGNPAPKSEADASIGFLLVTTAPVGRDVQITVSASHLEGAEFGEIINPATRVVTFERNQLRSGRFVYFPEQDEQDENDGAAVVSIVDVDPPIFALGTATLTVPIADDDIPELSVSSPATVTEGTAVEFTVTAEGNVTPKPQLTVALNIEAAGDFVAEEDTGDKTVVLNFNGGKTATYTIPTIGDEEDEIHGNVRVTIADTSPADYTVATASAVTAIEDDELPVVSACQTRFQGTTCQSYSIPESSGTYYLFTSSTPVERDTLVFFTLTDPDNVIAGHGTLSATIRRGRTQTSYSVVSRGDHTPGTGGGVATIRLNDASDSRVSGYIPAPPPHNSFTVTVYDDDPPRIAVCQANEAGDGCLSTPVARVEGTTLRYILTVDPATHSQPVRVRAIANNQGAVYLHNPNSVSQDVFIPAGQSRSPVFTVPTEDDRVDEPNGSVLMMIGTPSGFDGRHGGYVSIPMTDNDTPLLTATPADPGGTVGEGADAVFIITADIAPRSDLTVRLTIRETGGDVVDGVGEEEVERFEVLRFGGGTTATYAVETTVDEIDEPTSFVYLTLLENAGQEYTVEPGTVIVEVSDDDPPDLSICQTVDGETCVASPVDIPEGDSEDNPGGHGNDLIFLITATSAPAGNLPIRITTDVDAVPSGAIDPLAALVDIPLLYFIPAGQTTATFRYTTNSNRLQDGHKRVTVTIEPGEGYTVNEENSVASIIIRDDEPASIRVCPANSTGNDCQITAGTTPGPVGGGSASGGSVSPDSVSPDSVAPAQEDTHEEGEIFDFLVRISYPLEEDVTVQVMVSETTTEGGFLQQPGIRTVTIPAGQVSSPVFTVVTVDDSSDEGGEEGDTDRNSATIMVELVPESVEAAAEILGDSEIMIDGSAAPIALTIVDNDDEPAIGFVRERFVGDEGSPLVFTVRLSAPSGREVALSYMTSGGGESPATENTDYTPVPAPGNALVIPAGVSEASFSVETAFDEEDEGMGETFAVTLSAPDNAELDSSNLRAIGHITEFNFVEEVNKVIIPRMARVFAAQTGLMIEDRVRTAFSGGGGGAETSTPGTGKLTVRGKDWRRFIASAAAGSGDDAELPELNLSDFAFTLAAGDGYGSGWGAVPSRMLGNISAWGSGYLRDVESDGIIGSVSFDGPVIGAMAGVDTIVVPKLLAGVAGHVFITELDFEAIRPPDGSTKRGGTHEMFAWSVHPYLGWNPTPRITAWASGGYGMGESEVTSAMKPCTEMTCGKRDFFIMTFAAGGSGTLLDGPVGKGRMKLDAIADISYARIMQEGKNDEADLEADGGSVRLGLEVSGSRSIKEIGRLGASFEMAYRGDFGDGVQGGGFEVAGGIKGGIPKWGVRMNLEARALTSHTDDVKERGVSGDLRWSLNTDGTGPFVSFTPQWGATRDKSRTLWDEGITAISADEGAGRRYNLEAGYGVPLVYESGVMKLFARSEIENGVAVKKSGGVDVEMAGGISAGYETVDEASRAEVEHRGFIKFSRRF